MSTPNTEHIKAIRLFNLPDGSCTFEEGFLQDGVTIDAKGFFAKTRIEAYQKVAHPAPRRQFVITLQGTLEFAVTNGDTFIIHPGIVLIAEDTEGPGHTWSIIEGHTWHRIYIPLPAGNNSHFMTQ